MRAVLYSRVANDNTFALEAQEQRLLNYATSCGCTIVDQIQERSTGTSLDREGIHRLIQLAESRRIDTVLVTKMTRLSRATTDALTLLRKLKALDVEVIATEEPNISDHLLGLFKQIAGGTIHG